MIELGLTRLVLSSDGRVWAITWSQVPVKSRAKAWGALKYRAETKKEGNSGFVVGEWPSPWPDG